MTSKHTPLTQPLQQANHRQPAARAARRPTWRVAGIALLSLIGSALSLHATAGNAADGGPVSKAPGTSVSAPTAVSAKAVFAGGCFWCVESDFDAVPGVISTTSGYTGGTVANPTYQQVSAKGTGHAEAVEVVYDPARVSYAQLVEHYWRTIDPTTKDRQFCDVGTPYRTAIFAQDEAQLQTALASKAALEKTKPFKEPIVTEVVRSGAFYPAEAYHQDYYLKNPVRYRYYSSSCGRDARVQQLWGAKAAKH